MKVSAADDGNVFRHPKPLFQNRIDSTNSKRIVVTKDPIRPGIATQQEASSLKPLLNAIRIDIAGAHHIFRNFGKTAIEQSRLVAFVPADACAVHSPANMRDPPAADVEQVLGSDAPCSFIIYAHKVGGKITEVAINEDEVLLPPLKELELLNVVPGGGDHKRVESSGEQLANLPPLKFRIFFGGSNDQGISFFPNGGRQRLGDLSIEGMQQTGDHQTNEVTATRNKAARQFVWLIIQLFHPFQNPVPGFFSYIRVVA